jgi:hypothetical protein
VVNISIIGGSNSVLAPGYVTELVPALARQGCDARIVQNLAVGNTTSITGLLRLVASDQWDKTDVLVIEYALNDASAYGELRSAVESWAVHYEAIIRHALGRNRQIKIVSLIMAAQRENSRKQVPSVASAIYYMSEWYGVAKVDVQRVFTERFGRSFEKVTGIYSDAAHYARPLMTVPIAELLASEIILSLQKKAIGPLPSPIDPRSARDLSTLECSLWTAHPAEFKNSRFKSATFDLSEADIVLEIDGGQPIAIEYVCVPNVAKLYLSRNEDCYVVPMLRAGIRDGKFKFLMAGANLEDLPATGAGVHVWRLGIGGDRFPGAKVLKQRGAPEQGSPEELVLPVARILHSGKLLRYSVEARAVQESAVLQS